MNIVKTQGIYTICLAYAQKRINIISYKLPTFTFTNYFYLADYYNHYGEMQTKTATVFVRSSDIQYTNRAPSAIYRRNQKLHRVQGGRKNWTGAHLLLNMQRFLNRGIFMSELRSRSFLRQTQAGTEFRNFLPDIDIKPPPLRPNFGSLCFPQTAITWLRRLVTDESRVRARVNSCGIWGEQNGTGTGFRSRDSSGSIESDYGLDDRAIGVRSPAGAKDFSSILGVQIGSGAHRASCPMGTGGPFPRGVTLTTHPHLVPRSWMSTSYTSSPPNASMACSGTALLFTLCFPERIFFRKIALV
jgi:hypothetical protein